MRGLFANKAECAASIENANFPAFTIVAPTLAECCPALVRVPSSASVLMAAKVAAPGAGGPSVGMGAEVPPLSVMMRLPLPKGQREQVDDVIVVNESGPDIDVEIGVIIGHLGAGEVVAAAVALDEAATAEPHGVHADVFH